MGVEETAAEVLHYCNLAAALGVAIFAGVTGTFVIRLKHLEFNAIWNTRLALVVVAAGWVVSFIIQSGVNHSPNDAVWFSFACRTYVVLKYLLFEPAFFLIILHIIRFTIQPNRSNSVLAPGNSILLTAALWLALYSSLQFSLALIGTFGPWEEDMSQTYLYADESASKYGVCHMAIASVALNGILLTLFIVFYATAVRVVLLTAVNNRLIQVLGRLHTCGAVLLPASLACRIAFVVLDSGYSGEFDRAQQIIMGMDTLCNASCAALGIWVFVWRPVQDAAIYPLVRTQWDLAKADSTRDLGSSELPSPLHAAVEPHSYMELKVKQAGDDGAGSQLFEESEGGTMDLDAEHTERNPTADWPTDRSSTELTQGRRKKKSGASGEGTRRKKKKKSGESGTLDRPRRPKKDASTDLTTSSIVSKRVRKKKKPKEHQEEDEENPLAPDSNNTTRSSKRKSHLQLSSVKLHELHDQVDLQLNPSLSSADHSSRQI